MAPSTPSKIRAPITVEDVMATVRSLEACEFNKTRVTHTLKWLEEMTLVEKEIALLAKTYQELASSTQDQATRERHAKLTGLLVATAQKQGYDISTHYALYALHRCQEKLLDALAWVKDDITKREEALKATGRINWNKEMAIHDMQKKFTGTPEDCMPETRDQRLSLLEEDEYHIKEIGLNKWNSKYAQSLMAQHQHSEEGRLKIFNAYLFEAHLRECRSKYYLGLKNQGIVAETLDKFMEQWDQENDEQNYVVNSMRTAGIGEELPAYSQRREQENSLMGRLPAYNYRHGSGEASSSSSGKKVSTATSSEPLEHLQAIEDAQAAAAEDRGKQIDLSKSTEIIDFLNDPRGAEIIFRKLDAHEMDLFEKFEYVKWLLREVGLGFKAKERLTKQAKLYLEHVRAIHYKDYDLVEKLVDGTQIIKFAPKNKSRKTAPERADTAGEGAGESSRGGASSAEKYPSKFVTDPDTAPPFHLGISKPEFQRACDDVVTEKQHEAIYREPRVGGPEPAPYIFPFPKAAMPKISQKNLAKMDSTCVYSSATGKGKGKEKDTTSLAQTMMAELADAKKTAVVPEAATPRRASQSLFQKLMKGKYEPAIASQSSSAAPTSNPQSSSPKFFFKPKYIPTATRSSSSAPPKYKTNNRQQGLNSKFKEMVVDEDGEPVIGDFHDVSDDEEDDYDASDDEDGIDAGDEDSEASFDPDMTAVEGNVGDAEQQETILGDAERQEAMLRYQDIQPEADEYNMAAALEMTEVVNKLSHNIRGFYFDMFEQHLMLGGGKLYNGPYSPEKIAKFFTLLEEPPIEGIKVRTVTELLGLCGNSPARAHALFQVMRDHLDVFYIREDIVDPDFPMYEKQMLGFINFVWKRCYILAKGRME